MTLLHKDGFELAAPLKVGWDAATQCALSPGQGRRDGSALAISPSNGDGSVLRKDLLLQNKISVGFAMRKEVAADYAFLNFYLSSGITDYSAATFEVWVEFYFASSSRFRIYNTSGEVSYESTALLDLVNWHYYEILLDVTNQTLSFYVDNELKVNLLNFSSVSVDTVTFRGWDSSPSGVENHYLDDLYIADELLGEIAIVPFAAVADISVSGFTPSVGTSVAATVDELPLDESDYSQSTDVGNKVSMTVNPVLASLTGDIIGVDWYALVNNPDGGIGSGLIPGIIQNSVESVVPEVTGTNIDVKLINYLWTINPATGLSFTLEEVLAIEGFSVEVSS